MKTKILLAVFLCFFGISSICYGGEVVLLFPEPNLEEEKSSAYGGPKTYVLKKETGEKKYSETKLLEFVRKFEEQDYKIEQIELWVSGKVESGGVTRLLVSMEGEGGCRVILKPSR